MRFAYADPPYIGQAKKHYSHDPNCAEVDHLELVARLNGYDGWALSLSSPSLATILPMCPPDVRVMAWVKPFAAFKANVGVAYTWEPVIVRGGRKRTREQDTMRDYVSAGITLQKGLCGAKPEAFCYWLLQVLNLELEDTLDDLYPGTGVMGKCLAHYLSNAQPKLPLQFDERSRITQEQAEARGLPWVEVSPC